MTAATRIAPTPPKGTPAPRYAVRSLDWMGGTVETPAETRVLALALTAYLRQCPSTRPYPIAILSSGKRVRIGGGAK